MQPLAGKVILVTGASSGLGAATARVLAAQGAHIALAARRRDKGEAVADEITSSGGQALFIEADVTRTEDIAAMVQQTIAHFGGLDGAVNNAGVGGPVQKPVADISERGWDATFATNVRAVFVCMKHQIPALLARGKGAIVNVASIYGLEGSDLGHAAYSASKHAVIGLTKSAAIDYAAQGLRVNAVCPGFAHSEMMDPLETVAPDFLNAMVTRHSAAKRMAESDEVANAIAWLLSDAASFVNGAALPINGGDSARLY